MTAHEGSAGDAEPGDEGPFARAAPVLAALGWHVLPLYGIGANGACACRVLAPGRENRCKPGKHPIPRNGVEAATTDARRIANWGASYPAANVGVALWPSGLVVVAPDSPAWDAAFHERGLPPTVTARSGGGDGHWHYYYARPAGVPAARICVSGEYDIVSDGYVVAAPSGHESGRAYEWRVPPGADRPLPDAPDWVARLLRDRADRLRADPDDADGAWEIGAPALADAPPVPLDRFGLQRWYGERPAFKADGQVDRSLTLFAIAGDLVRSGASTEQTARAIANRDVAFGFRKYADRASACRTYRAEARRAHERVFG